MPRAGRCLSNPRIAAGLVVAALAWWGLMAPASQAQDAGGAAIIGRWLTESHDGVVGIIEITRTAEGSYQGRIIGGNAPHRLDTHNPDPALRQQILRGQVILRGLRPEGEGRWAGGTIYDPDSGRTYQCRIEPLERDRLKVRGFIGLSLLGRNQTWTRYSGSSLDLPPAAP
ncbi:MAG: DUF2147 domain-containing protein [Steroidobacterales bacterium]